MKFLLGRRSFAAAAIGPVLGRALPARAGFTAQPAAPDAARHAHDALAALEARHGGRLGVVALDTGPIRTIAWRGDERFAMCSTHKFLTAAAILATVDQGHLQLDGRVHYSRAELLEYAPITRKNAEAGWMTIDALCAAAIEWSDNTAANLLLGLIGGPAGWTRYARSIGDSISRLDRTEPTLNTAIPGDPRDTTTPDAMAHDLHAVLLGEALSHASRTRLQGWMLASRIGDHLLRAGLPRALTPAPLPEGEGTKRGGLFTSPTSGWRVADKSGSGGHGTRNDIGMIFPPQAAPIAATVYYTGSKESLSSREHVIAEAGRIIARAFAS